MASVNRNHEMSVAGWTVRGTLLSSGSESVLGGARYKFKAPNSDAWLPRTTNSSPQVQEQISLTKDKIKQILRARLAQAVAKDAEAGTKAAKPKALAKDAEVGTKAAKPKALAKDAEVGTKAAKPKALVKKT